MMPPGIGYGDTSMQLAQLVQQRLPQAYEQLRAQAWGSPEAANAVRQVMESNRLAQQQQQAIASGMNPQRGQVTMMGGQFAESEVPWEEQQPVSSGAPWDTMPGSTYGDRLAAAQATLQQKRADRPPLSDEDRNRFRDMVLAARFNRRSIEKGRAQLRREKIPLHQQYANMRAQEMANRAAMMQAMHGRGGGGGLTAPMVSLMRMVQDARQDQIENERSDRQFSAQQEQQRSLADQGNALRALLAGQQMGATNARAMAQELGLQRRHASSQEGLENRSLRTAQNWMARYLSPREQRRAAGRAQNMSERELDAQELQDIALELQNNPDADVENAAATMRTFYPYMSEEEIQAFIAQNTGQSAGTGGFFKGLGVLGSGGGLGLAGTALTALGSGGGVPYGVGRRIGQGIIGLGRQAGQNIFGG